MTVLATVKIGQNFRVTLPREVRETLELKEGDELVFFTVKRFERRVCFRLK
ncbi:AbrB/MazE/SpoVT family DNA-binding domain-containing protein [Candidatus Bathyarchaeota archaeon]|nr:AbrB/MazE/SpoVT family DNA-binding domain-containing protein [Candidatus Bathyarchaeota archaeon]